MKKILVTVGSGFLGTHLCLKLLKKKHYVICLDNFQTSNKKKINHLLEFKNFKFLKHDIIKPINIKVDEIYNLASPASPIQYQLNPVKTIKTNVSGIINMLDLAKKNNAKILQASTSEVYGNPSQSPQTEKYWGNVNPIGPRACYDEGKRCAETLLFDFHRQYNVKIKLIRIFNTYGPGMQIDDGRVISNFICQAILNKPITIYGNGKQTRSFCYYSDMIDGMISMMNSNQKIIGPINLGNNLELSMLQIAKKIILLTNSKSKLVYKKLPVDDPIQRQPDLTKAKKLLSWKPKIKIDDGIIKTISYFRKNIK